MTAKRLSLWLAMLALACPMALAAEAPRPNIVFVLADDLGSYDVGWRGSEIKTPNLDRLARSGATFEQFYVQPVCSPTRAALMTGRYPCRYGLQVGVVRPWAQYGLPLDERMLPQALHEAGYQTAITGKWHLGHYRPEYLPTRRGFDHQYGHYNGAIDYFTHIRDDGFDWHRDDRENHDPGYSTELIGAEAARLIRARDPKRPLFLYVPFNAVHAPHQVPERYTQAYTQFEGTRRTYAGMVAAMDEAIGRISMTLDAEKLTSNTLFIFSSDNGGPRPGVVTDNGPLRSGKATLYEGGVRVAAFATWPGKIESGKKIEAAMHMVDWYPTLLKLAGVQLDQPTPLDGRDIWPTITAGASSPHEEILLNATPAHGAIRMGDWKLVLNGQFNAADGEDRPVKAGDKRAELFNLRDDPSEKNDLASQHPAELKRLRDRYEAIAREAAPPLARGRTPGFKSPKVWGQADGAAP